MENIAQMYQDELSQFDDDDAWEGCFPTYLCQNGNAVPANVVNTGDNDEQA